MVVSGVMRTFRVNVYSLGVAEITASTKAEAGRRARAGDFDRYELQKPSAAITSLGEGEPVATGVRPIQQPVVFRSGAS
jgi:hypothetical protein